MAFFYVDYPHAGMSRSSRTLLFTETDEFGNVVDPDSGSIISRVGGQSPNFPPPWVYQTPALFSTRPDLPNEYEPHLRTEILPTAEKQTETAQTLESANRSVDNSETTSSSEQHR